MEPQGFCLYDYIRHYRVKAWDGDYLIPWYGQTPPTYEQIKFAINEFYRCKCQFEYFGTKKFQ